MMPAPHTNRTPSPRPSQKGEGDALQPSPQPRGRGQGEGAQESRRAPLDGVRILSVSQFGAGPFGTQVLADLGAEIIKIEDPGVGGDSSRYVPPYLAEQDSLYFQSFNRGKKSLTLNLRHPAGQAVLHDLVKVSDAVFNNARGDLPAALGLTYEALKAVNPRIVCCSLT